MFTCLKKGETISSLHKTVKHSKKAKRTSPNKGRRKLMRSKENERTLNIHNINLAGEDL